MCDDLKQNFRQKNMYDAPAFIFLLSKYSCYDRMLIIEGKQL